MWTGWYLQPDDVWHLSAGPSHAILNPDFLFSTGNMSDITETEKTSVKKADAGALLVHFHSFYFIFIYFLRSKSGQVFYIFII